MLHHNHNDQRYRLLGAIIMIASICGYSLMQSRMATASQMSARYKKIQPNLAYTTRAVFQPEESTDEFDVFVLHNPKNHTVALFCKQTLPWEFSLILIAQQPMYSNRETGQCLHPKLVDELKAADWYLGFTKFFCYTLIVFFFFAFLFGTCILFYGPDLDLNQQPQYRNVSEV